MILEQIKDKLKLSNNKSEKFLLLTLAPININWSHIKLMTEFNLTERKARLVEKRGILTTSRVDISRVMPGMEDFIL